MDTAVLREELNCPICLNIYTDPVILSCGHNFCRVCIDRVLDTQERSEGFECPKCRKVFNQRESIQRNVTLRNIADYFLSTQPKREESENFCTYCIHFQVPAVKMCVLCEASLCDNHLKVHSKSPEHVLSDLNVSLKDRKCVVHGEMLKYFCSDHNVCICVSCFLVGDHKGHQAELLPEAAVKMKDTLTDVLEELNKYKNKAEGQLQILQDSQLKVPEIAAGIKEKINNLLRNIREQLEGLGERIITQISNQEEKALQAISDLTKRLQEDSDALTKEITETKDLLEVTDPLTVLQECETDKENENVPEKEISDDQIHSAAKLDEGLVAETFHTGLCDIVNDVKKHLQIQKATDIILDANTAGPNVLLSNDFKSASKTNNNPHYYNSPQGFTDYAQVLSSNALWGGPCYWDVDTGDSSYYIVGMAYPSIERRGRKSLIGSNNKSWGLRKAGYTYVVSHNAKEMSLSGNSYGRKIRVYLDYGAGRLSFYDLTDPIRHLHTFMTTFSEPLHAALYVESSWVRITS